MTNEIRIQDFSTNAVFQLKGHNGEVTAIAFHNGKLYSASRDHTIKIWDIETQQCIKTFEGVDVDVCEMIITEGKLVTASSNGKIMVRNYEDGSCLKTFQGDDMMNRYYRDHEGKNAYLSAHDGKLFCKTANNKIEVWDLEIGTNLKTMELPTNDHEFYKKDFSIIVEGKLYLGSHKKKITILDIMTGKCIKTFDELDDCHRPLAVEEGKFFTHCDDLIWIWDLETGKPLKQLKECGYRIYQGIKFGSRKIISYFDDMKLMVWDFNATDKAILEEIARTFKNADIEELLIERFNNMPEKIKKKIYAELYLILNPNTIQCETIEQYESAKNAFNKQYPFFKGNFSFVGKQINHLYKAATPFQKARAIKNYLKKSEKEVPVL